MFYKTLYPTRQPDDFDAYIARLKTNLREPGRFAALKGLAAAPKTPSEERLGQVKAPALVVMGTKDPDWPDPEYDHHPHRRCGRSERAFWHPGPDQRYEPHADFGESGECDR